MTASQTTDYADLGNIETLTVFLNASAASTINVQTSPDGTEWYNTVSWSPTNAGSEAVSVPPAPYVRVSSSAAITLTAQVYGVGGW